MKRYASEERGLFSRHATCHEISSSTLSPHLHADHTPSKHGVQVKYVIRVEHRELKPGQNEQTEHKEYETRVELKPHFQTRDFFRQEVQLHSWPQTCMPGQYQFPFSFTLPTAIPGSFVYEDKDVKMHGRHYTQIR